MVLINREDFRDRMYHEAFEVDSELQKWDSGCWVRYKLFEKILDEMPIIESRPKGKWLNNAIGWKCSQCGRPHIVQDNFCPNCGVKMEDDIHNEIDGNIDPCKGCEDYIDGECISKGGCGNCVHLSCVDRYTEVSQYCNGVMRGEGND